MDDRASSPTYSATQLTKAMTSCRVTASISSMRATVKRAFFLMVSRLFFGILPRLAHASHAASSTSSHFR